jgi:hypothetical protein
MSLIEPLAQSCSELTPDRSIRLDPCRSTQATAWLARPGLVSCNTSKRHDRGRPCPQTSARTEIALKTARALSRKWPTRYYAAAITRGLSDSNRGRRLLDRRRPGDLSRLVVGDRRHRPRGDRVRASVLKTRQHHDMPPLWHSLQPVTGACATRHSNGNGTLTMDRCNQCIQPVGQRRRAGL